MRKEIKIGNIFLLIILFLISISLSAQDRDILNEFNLKDMNKIPNSLLNVISINLEKVPFEQALNEIAAKGNFVLNYNNDRIPVKKKVTVKMNDVAALRSLIKILRDTNTGLIITKEGQIVIVPVNEAAIKFQKQPEKGKIKGTVIDKATKIPLTGANVIVEGTVFGAATDNNGKFLISNLPEGTYTIEVSYLGYKKERAEGLEIKNGSIVEIEFELIETIVQMEEIIVTPGHFSILERQSNSATVLKEEDIKSFPQFGDDIYRAIRRLPGLSSGEFSAKFNVRGGDQNEVLVLLDGMELYDPFHMKDIDGALSIIDIEAIKSIDMMTGAFPADYGNHLSGILNMKTGRKNMAKSRTYAAISLLNTKFLTEGNFNNGKGYWQFLARRGYLDLIIDLIDVDISLKPVYHDVLGKFQYFLNEKHHVSAHILLSNDKFKYSSDEFDETLNSGYGNSYTWLTWDAQFHQKLFARTLFSVGRISQDRLTKSFYRDITEFWSSDKHGFDFFGIKQDWKYKFSDNFMIKWGFDYKKLKADYDYSNMQYWDQINTILKHEEKGTQLGLFISNRFRIFSPLVAEFGLRYDETSWTGDKDTSPRINLVYNAGNQTTFRAGWGKFYQTHDIHKLNIVDDDYNFYPSGLAEHSVIGFEHTFNAGLKLRIEAYRKKHSQIQPRYENFMYPIDATPDWGDDRIKIEPESGDSRGIEFYLYNEKHVKHSWWISYAYSKFEETIDGITRPKKRDQRHSLNIDYSYRPNKYWSLNIAWTYHTGWPYTEAKYEITESEPPGGYYINQVPGDLYAKRYPAFHRMDLRISRFFYTEKGLISFFFEFMNLYNRKNVREYTYELSQIYSVEKYTMSKIPGKGFPLLPSVGISWEF